MVVLLEIESFIISLLRLESEKGGFLSGRLTQGEGRPCWALTTEACMLLLSEGCVSDVPGVQMGWK